MYHLLDSVIQSYSEEKQMNKNKSKKNEIKE